MFFTSILAHAQIVADRIFLNNFEILCLKSNFTDSMDKDLTWIIADLSVQDIAGKDVYISKYEYADRFGELTLLSTPSDEYSIMKYDTVSNNLNYRMWSINYNDRKKLNYSTEYTYIIPDYTTSNQDVSIKRYYQRSGNPTGECIHIKYDANKRIVAWAGPENAPHDYMHITYNGNSFISGFSTIENFNPKAYIKQKHMKVEYRWIGNDIQSVQISMIYQSSSRSSLTLIKTIDCKIIEKTETGKWTKMDVVEKSDLQYGEPKMIQYRLIREFKDIEFSK